MPHRNWKFIISCTLLSMVAVGLVWTVIAYADEGRQKDLSASESVVHFQDSLPTPDPSQVISVCSQHAPKCPLDPQNWPGEPDGWQFTGKKWAWYPYTINRFNRHTIWEYSQPYQGTNPDYMGQREDHYSDYTNSPDEYPAVQGRAPKTYDWERWMPVGDNFKVMQLGNNSEARSYLLGETDCSTGIFYPVVDHTQPYFYSPMYTNRWGECTGDGYVAAYLNELWGEPLSKQRLELCDNKINGVPAEFSPVGNIVCKISPYVGTVYQRYIFGPRRPGSRPSVGCEAVLYAWGWTEPENPRSGQDYQAWFRNGELRFTRWYELSRSASACNPPAPDDHEWWNHMCQGAWTGEGNWLYTGTFRAGQTVFHDQAELPVLTVAEVSPAGGVLRLEEIGATFGFPSGTFSDTVRVVKYSPEPMELPPTGEKILVGPAFRIFAEHEDSHEIVQPLLPYQVSIQYSAPPEGSSANIKVGLYYWDGYDWLLEPSSTAGRGESIVSAEPDHFSLWAVLAENNSLYLPRVQTRRR
jgi:hypothetical protein